MFKVFLFTLLINIAVIASYKVDTVVENTELLMTFLVHRHGDRTPTEFTIAHSTDVDAVRAKTAKYGTGQLTDVGKRRAYQLGQFIRNRYDKLLSPNYNKSEIYIRSTDSTRTKMTVLASMSAVYPVNDSNWSSYIKWTPVPYTTVPAKYDPNLSLFNCPNFVAVKDRRQTSASHAMDPYTDILNKWSKLSGNNVSSMPFWPIVLYDVYISQISLGVPVPDEIAKLLPEMEKAASAAWNIIYAAKDTLAMQAGVLLRQFFIAADRIIGGEDVPKVHVLSGHDLNVLSFAGASRITPDLGVVKYASMFALELRRDCSGQYLVVPVHLPTPSNSEYNYLQVDGCDGFCDLDSFRNLTSQYTLDESSWKAACAWSENYIVLSKELG